jgi:hypothetical protein
MKGSQKWLQEAVNNCPEILNCAIRESMKLEPDEKISWLSPLEDDDYAEYRDQSFVEKLGAELPIRPLKTFWPRGGPVWDGLARTDSGQLILIEAKARVAELTSSPLRAAARSMGQIQHSLEETHNFLSTKITSGWSNSHYQYQNRLAHLYLLRELNKLPAWLVCIHFVNSPDVRESASVTDWKKAIRIMHSQLGILHHRLLPYVIYIYLDINDFCLKISEGGKPCRCGKIASGSFNSTLTSASHGV